MLYLDCSNGVSGDMLVGALVDLGADFEKIEDAVSGIAEVDLHEVNKKGVKAKKFYVKFTPERRDYVSLKKQISGLQISQRSKKLATGILKTLALAESRAHRVPPEEIHLHEAVDSIVDAISFSIAIENLKINGVTSSIVSVGKVAPATDNIIKQNKIPVVFKSDMEIATPTGAAILTNIVDKFENLEANGKAGFGAGDFDLPYPNVLRAVLL